MKISDNGWNIDAEWINESFSFREQVPVNRKQQFAKSMLSRNRVHVFRHIMLLLMALVVGFLSTDFLSTLFHWISNWCILWRDCFIGRSQFKVGTRPQRSICATLCNSSRKSIRPLQSFLYLEASTAHIHLGGRRDSVIVMLFSLVRQS